MENEKKPENQDSNSTIRHIMSGMGMLLLLVSLLMEFSGFKDFGYLTTSVLYREDVLNGIANAETVIEKPEVNCRYAKQITPKYSGEFLGIRRKGTMQPEEMYQVKVSIKNTSNIPWFSIDSGCKNESILNLGTNNEKDRSSVFAAFLGKEDSGWIGKNRLKMDQKRVSPLETATFTFWVEAPKVEGRYREIFSPVVEGVTWIEDKATVTTDIWVGKVAHNPIVEQYLPYIQKSVNISKLDLNGEKKIIADLSDQRMFLKIGDTEIRNFPISSGKRGTPTPTGTYRVLTKQEVRIASKPPHYIMPYFLKITNVGHGLHGLPSLGNDRGIFWSEALNHIGIPVSHGCVRLLPEDAKFTFEFSEVGTPVTVQW